MDHQNSHKNDEHGLANDSPEMRAKRLKRVRNLANLTREQMCGDKEINRNTLIGWENARFGGLTMSGAKKILAKVLHEGVHCTLEWLMNGTGPEPSVNPIPLVQENNSVELNEDLIITYELAFFKAKNSHAADLIVDDEGMLPQYHEGDYVAGKKKTGAAIQHTLGYDCIVQTETGEILLRNVREGKAPGTYTLVCNNPAVRKRNSVVPDVKLIYAAPVIWHRKKDISA